MASLTRSRGQIVLAVVFTLLGLNAWAQVFNAVIGDGGDPAALVVLQIIVGASGLAAPANRCCRHVGPMCGGARRCHSRKCCLVLFCGGR